MKTKLKKEPINSKKSLYKTIFNLVLAVIGIISVIVAINSFNKNLEARRMLNSANQALEQKNDSLQVQKEQLAIWQGNLAIANDSLISLIKTIAKIEDKTNIKFDIYGNAKFSISIITYQTKQETYDKVINYLTKNTYNINLVKGHTDRTEWMADKPTILIYHGFGVNQAYSIKDDLENLLNIDFIIEVGDGIGLIEEHRKWTIVIHLIDV